MDREETVSKEELRYELAASGLVIENGELVKYNKEQKTRVSAVPLRDISALRLGHGWDYSALVMAAFFVGLAGLSWFCVAREVLKWTGALLCGLLTPIMVSVAYNSFLIVKSGYGEVVLKLSDSAEDCQAFFVTLQRLHHQRPPIV